jgi:hypothetical protein
MHRATRISSAGTLTADRRASSWGQGDQPIEFAEILSLNSVNDLSDSEMNVGAGGVYNEQIFTPATPSRLPNVASSSRVEPTFDEEQRFGPACFDEDSSTIASVFGDEEGWENGSNMSEGEGEGEEEEGDDDDDDDGPGEDDSDDQDDNAVTFSPRKRPPTTQD